MRTNGTRTTSDRDFPLRAPALAPALIGALALALLATPLAAEEVTVPLTDPDRPAAVAVKATFGKITVEGYDGREVRIEVTGSGEDERKGEPGPDGMRRIPNRSFGLSAEEEDNTVQVHLRGPQAGAIHLLVPRRTSVYVKTVNGGELVVRGVAGEHELSNVNGGITAEDVSGVVVAHTTNGPVRVTLERADPGKPMSFVTLNGDVDVALPPGYGADLRLKTTNGEIFTDFAFSPERSGPEVREGERGGRYRVEVKKEVRGAINGGGAEVRMQTMNGDVLVRKGE